MAADLDTVIASALELTNDERAQLIATLKPRPAEADLLSDAAWNAEIERRARAALAGEPGVEWTELRAQIESKHKSK